MNGRKNNLGAQDLITGKIGKSDSKIGKMAFSDKNGSN